MRETDFEHMTPVAPGMVRISISGLPEACDEWVELLDRLAGWRPATTWEQADDPDQIAHKVTAILVHGTQITPQELNILDNGDTIPATRLVQ